MGLMSTLAMSTAVTASLASGIQPVDAPDLESQHPSHVQSVGSPHIYNQKPHNNGGGQETQEDDLYVDQVTSMLLNDGSSQSSRVGSNSSEMEGIDISSHQHGSEGEININQALSTGGQDFVFVKATEGTGYQNPHYRNDTISVINNDKPVGFYHYAKPTKKAGDGRKQADFFLSVTGIDKGVKSLPPVLDIEENEENLSASELSEWVKDFTDRIHEKTGRYVMIYTYPTFWMSDMGNTTEFSDLPLWIAHYTHADSPTLPGGWTDWTFWQYTSTGKVSGYPKDIDMNYFNGNQNTLKSMYL